MIIFWIALLAVIIWAVTRYRGSETRLTGGNTSLDIARKHYANGEISREEFEQLKKDLS